MKFTVIVVSYNAGDKLISTLESVLRQTGADMNILVKDACSTDGSFERARKRLSDERIFWVSEPDNGIYDGMDRAVELLISGKRCPAGDFILFLNCGDILHDDSVLSRVAADIESDGRQGGIYYGDIIELKTGQRIAANRKMDAFACFRNVPCHQACFYETGLMGAETFDTDMRVRGDYEHFLRCVLKKGVRARFMDIVICDYEGGGFSESDEGKRVSAREHKEITKRYFTASQRFRYRLYMALSLQPLRHRIATGRLTAGAYNAVRNKLLCVVKDD